MIALWSTVFIASLLGSTHCAGMCGGLVAFYSGADRRAGAPAGPSHIAYHGARLVLYALLGALAGVAGGLVDDLGSWVGLQRAALAFAGLVLIAYGARGLLLARGITLRPLPGTQLLSALVRRSSAGLAARGPLARASLLGALTGLLPCGWLYAFVATAVGAGGALGGALVMAVFWLGTLPVLVALGVGVRLAVGRFAARLPAFVAVLLIVSGVWTVATRGRALERLGRPTLAASPTAPDGGAPHSLPTSCHDPEQSPAPGEAR